MAFFDPNNSQFDPSNYNYQNAQQRIALSNALGQNLYNTPMPQGQLVPGQTSVGSGGGWYVPPSKGAMLASALSKLAGAYVMSKSLDASKQNDANSMAALQYQLNNPPQGTPAQPAAQPAQPAPSQPVVTPGDTSPGLTEAPINPDGSTGPAVQDPPVVTPATVDLTQQQAAQPPAQPDPNAGPLAGAVAAQNGNPAPQLPVPPQNSAVGAVNASAPPNLPPANPAIPAAAPQAPAQPAVPPTMAEKLAYLGKLSQTGPLGQQVASGMLSQTFPTYEWQVDHDNGVVIGTNKNNPNAPPIVQSYVAPGTVTLGQSNIAKNMAEAGKANTDSATGLVNGQSNALTGVQTAQANIIKLNAALADSQRMQQLSAQVGSKYPEVGSLEQLFTNYAKSDPAVQELQQLYAANTIGAAKDAIAGAGRLTQTDMDVFKDATPSMKTNPAAVANLASRQQQLLANQIQTENAVLGERKNQYLTLGGNPRVFGNPNPAVAPQPTQANVSVPQYKQPVFNSPYALQPPQ